MSTVAAYAMVGDRTDQDHDLSHLARTTWRRHRVRRNLSLDIHTAKAECQLNYPAVPGHEIAGVVTAAPSTGRRPRWGCLRTRAASAQLHARHEQYCKPGANFTYNSIGKDGQPTQGGYCEAIVVDETTCCAYPTCCL